VVDEGHRSQGQARFHRRHVAAVGTVTVRPLAPWEAVTGCLPQPRVGGSRSERSQNGQGPAWCPRPVVQEFSEPPAIGRSRAVELDCSPAQIDRGEGGRRRWGARFDAEHISSDGGLALSSGPPNSSATLSRSWAHMKDGKPVEGEGWRTLKEQTCK
jgi:hypothetical protein